MSKSTTPRRVARATSTAAREFRHYSSAYRRCAREAGIPPDDRFQWLTGCAVRNRLEREHKPTTGAGLLAFAGKRAPVDAHDAALRVLAQWAPGLGADFLTHRATMRVALAAHGVKFPFFRLSHR